MQLASLPPIPSQNEEKYLKGQNEEKYSEGQNEEKYPEDFPRYVFHREKKVNLDT
jgi:hypothetical protein